MGWPVVALGEVVRHRKEFITIQPDETYSRCRVQTSARGIVLRDRVPGDAIKTKKQQVCRAGEFLVAEIDAKLGGYGLVPDELNGAIVSSHYFLFEVDEKHLLRKFLHWYCQTPNFLEQVNARGSTNYAAIRPGNVLTYTIPLPPLNEQQQVVAKLDKVAGLVGEAKSLQNNVKNEWKTLLVNMAHRPDLSASEKKECGWREVRLKEILTEAAVPYDVDPETSYPNLGIYSFARGAFAKPPIDGALTSAKTLYRVRKGQFIYSRLFAFEGAYTIVPAELDERFVSNEFPSFDIAEDAATPEFLAAFFMNPRVWTDLLAGSLGLGSRRQRVNQKHLVEYTIWLPPLAWQNRIGDVFGRFQVNARAEGQAIDTLMPAVLDGVFNSEAGVSWMFPNYGKK